MLHDPEAEATIAAYTLTSHHAAQRTHHTIPNEAWWDRQLHQLTIIALDLPAGLNPHERAWAAAHHTGWPPHWLCDLIDDRRTLRDPTGTWHQRIIDAWHHRQEAQHLAHQILQLGAHVELAMPDTAMRSWAHRRLAEWHDLIEALHP